MKPKKQVKKSVKVWVIVKKRGVTPFGLSRGTIEAYRSSNKPSVNKSYKVLPATLTYTPTGTTKGK